MKIPFTKIHGAGHSYILADAFHTELAVSQLPLIAGEISDVDTGIGSDGFIFVHSGETADVGIRIFNRVGHEKKTCGNGLRCAAKYAYENELVSSKTFSIETPAHVVEAEIAGENSKVTINMGKPDLRRPYIPMMGADVPQVINETFIVADEELKLTAVSMGDPHAVFFVDNIEDAPLHKLGPVIENDRRFPEGVNVEFAEIISGNKMNVLVWERDYGLRRGCGTGACAAVVAASVNGYMDDRKSVIVHMPGGNVEIVWDDKGDVRLTGGAVRIGSGSYEFPD